MSEKDKKLAKEHQNEKGKDRQGQEGRDCGGGQGGCPGCDSFFMADFPHIVCSFRAELAPNCQGAQGFSLPQPRPARMGKIIDLTGVWPDLLGYLFLILVPLFNSCEALELYSPLQASALLSMKWGEQNKYLLHW